MVAALAGRRIDAPDAQVHRFPARNIPVVRGRIRAVLAQVSALISSAACGADLIALEEAGKLGIRRRVVLPFERERFRETSVVDRPGEWGPVFDTIMDEVEGASDAVVLSSDGGDTAAYAAANAAILEEAERLSREQSEDVMAVIVWDGKPRGDDDLTAAFRDAAVQKRYAVSEISTNTD